MGKPRVNFVLDMKNIISEISEKCEYVYKKLVDPVEFKKVGLLTHSPRRWTMEDIDRVGAKMIKGEFNNTFEISLMDEYSKAFYDRRTTGKWSSSEEKEFYGKVYAKYDLLLKAYTKLFEEFSEKYIELGYENTKVLLKEPTKNLAVNNFKMESGFMSHQPLDYRKEKEEFDPAKEAKLQAQREYKSRGLEGKSHGIDKMELQKSMRKAELSRKGKATNLARTRSDFVKGSIQESFINSLLGGKRLVEETIKNIGFDLEIIEESTNFDELADDILSLKKNDEKIFKAWEKKFKLSLPTKKQELSEELELIFETDIDEFKKISTSIKLLLEI